MGGVLPDSEASIALFVIDDGQHPRFDRRVEERSATGLRWPAPRPCGVESACPPDRPQRFEALRKLLIACAGK